MMKLDFKQGWELRYEDLSWGTEKVPAVLDRQEGWLDVSLPCDIHMPLIENGIIKEPLEADYSFECEWTEGKSWWFKKSFEVSEEMLKDDIVELTLESLDTGADIFLNGFHLAHQCNAFYPFVLDVKRYLKTGGNILLVRLTTGMEYFSEKDIAYLKDYVTTEGVLNRGDKRRVFVRRPQYSIGWDWGPRLVTCGIVKGAWLQSHNRLVVRNVYTFARSVCVDAELGFRIEVENLRPYSTIEGSVKVEIYYGDLKVAGIDKDVLLKSGINYIDTDALVKDARLWWPNGMGEQPLYTIRVSACSEGIKTGYPDFRYGIRTIEVDMGKLGGNERKFAFKVNGVEIFCKGGNWIPADSIYARVTDEKYDILVREAKEANFNMLRVWGGGFYERNVFYEKCNEYGILVWHDFMLACGLYPDDQEWFQREFEKEADYQTRRLRNHACLALWCGNNENHSAYIDWFKAPGFFGGAICYNKIAPRVVRQNCPNIPYWNSSPYGGENPSDNNIGDRHHWGDCMMNPEMEKRITPEEYDRVEAKFVSEYGYVGPCRKSTIIKYHGGAELDKNGRIWQLHNNTFEKKTVLAGIEKHYIDPDKLDIDSYLLYAGLCQGLMYGYSLEAMRFKEKCWGGLFWMYNDCWGEVGWTIIDYYLKRKISYYFVKRAFAMTKLILRSEGNNIKVTGINDTTSAVSFDAEYGYMGFDGGNKQSSSSLITLEPYSRRVVLEFEKDNKDFAKGFCYVMPIDAGNGVLPEVLRTGTFRTLEIPESRLETSEFKNDESSARFTVSSSAYAHAVHFDLGDDVKLSDEYFDLLPGESREVVVYNPPAGLAQTGIRPRSIVLK